MSSSAGAAAAASAGRAGGGAQAAARARLVRAPGESRRNEAARAAPAGPACQP